LYLNKTKGNNKINSKSNNTNRMAKKKKGELKVKLGFKDSKPDSKGHSVSLSLQPFSERISCARNKITRTIKIKLIIKIIEIFI